MDKTIKTPRLDTFNEFCKLPKKKHTIKESNQIAVDVPFYNDAIERVLNDIHQVAGTPVEWKRLIDYLKIKNIIIDREINGEDFIVSAHIKDLLFQYYGETFLQGDVEISYNSATTGAKTLVVSQLADEIMHRILVEIGRIQEPSEKELVPIAKVSLEDGFYDDMSYMESNKNRVSGYGDYTTMLKEKALQLGIQHDEKCIDYCLNQLEKNGEVTIDRVLESAQKNGFKTLQGYLENLMEGYWRENPEPGEGQPNERGKVKLIRKQARHQFAKDIMTEMLSIIRKETKENDEKAK